MAILGRKPNLHLVTGQKPVVRLHGEMERLDYKILENDELKAMFPTFR